MLRFISLIFVGLIWLAQAAFAQVETSDLMIVTEGGEHAFTVEVVDEPEEIRGPALMFRESDGLWCRHVV